MPHKWCVRPNRSDDARALLPPMLEREKTVVGQDGSVRMAKDGKNAALVSRFVVLHSSEKEAESSGALGMVKWSRANNRFLNVSSAGSNAIDRSS